MLPPARCVLFIALATVFTGHAALAGEPIAGPCRVVYDDAPFEYGGPVGSPDGAPDRVAEYTYDKHGRLVRADREVFTYGEARSQAHCPDADYFALTSDRFVTWNACPTSRGWAGDDGSTSPDTTTTYTYDDEGHLLEISSYGKTLRAVRDDQGRMQALVDETGSQVERLIWDEQGRLVEIRRSEQGVVSYVTSRTWLRPDQVEWRTAYLSPSDPPRFSTLVQGVLDADGRVIATVNYSSDALVFADEDGDGEISPADLEGLLIGYGLADTDCSVPVAAALQSPVEEWRPRFEGPVTLPRTGLTVDLSSVHPDWRWTPAGSLDGPSDDWVRLRGTTDAGEPFSVKLEIERLVDSCDGWMEGRGDVPDWVPAPWQGEVSYNDWNASSTLQLCYPGAQTSLFVSAHGVLEAPQAASAHAVRALELLAAAADAAPPLPEPVADVAPVEAPTRVLFPLYPGGPAVNLPGTEQWALLHEEHSDDADITIYTAEQTLGAVLAITYLPDTAGTGCAGAMLVTHLEGSEPGEVGSASWLPAGWFERWTHFSDDVMHFTTACRTTGGTGTVVVRVATDPARGAGDGVRSLLYALVETALADSPAAAPVSASAAPAIAAPASTAAPTPGVEDDYDMGDDDDDDGWDGGGFDAGDDMLSVDVGLLYHMPTIGRHDPSFGARVRGDGAGIVWGDTVGLALGGLLELGYTIDGVFVGDGRAMLGLGLQLGSVLVMALADAGYDAVSRDDDDDSNVASGVYLGGEGRLRWRIDYDLDLDLMAGYATRAGGNVVRADVRLGFDVSPTWLAGLGYVEYLDRARIVSATFGLGF